MGNSKQPAFAVSKEMCEKPNGGINIKDKDKNIVKALNMIGYKIDSKQLEMILNVAEFVTKKGAETSIRDLTELEGLVNGLYEA